MHRRTLIWLLAGLLPGLARTGRAQTAGPNDALAPRVLTLAPDLFDWDPVTGLLSLRAEALPVADPKPRPAVNPSDKSAQATIIRRLVGRGKAAGLASVLYDNRDRGHSTLPESLFPDLIRLDYAPALRARNLDYGLDGPFRFPAITFGNSSTALTNGPNWRSLPRMAMTFSGAPNRAAADYGANALYVYPEHRDHDAVDEYPAAWPYTLTSQGSSGSDMPFLRMIGMILAALRPDTLARLQTLGLVAPTVQMILRSAQTGVQSRADYLSGAAHPSAFDAAALAPVAMVTAANNLMPDTIPPVVHLTVEAEDFSFRAGVEGMSEHLFDTPSAVARIWRDRAWHHALTLSTAQTQDPNGRPLRFDWILLRGDPARVRITPLDATGIRATISLDWQEARPAPLGLAATGSAPLTNRVDIGVFANNGAVDSAPAFVSIAFPVHQLRRYEPGPDGAFRLAGVNYDAKGRGAAFDPLLYQSAPWHDSFHYDATGTLTGWTRTATSPKGAAEAGDYDADGVLQP